MGETRVTIQEAARLLSVSEGAVRKRVKRDTLRHDKDEARRIYVYLDDGTHGVDEGIDEVPHPDSSTLISEMRARIESLEHHLEQANERDRENRRIIAALTSRIPEIEPPRETPSEAPEARVTPPEPVPNTETRPRIRSAPPGGVDSLECDGMGWTEVLIALAGILGTLGGTLAGIRAERVRWNEEQRARFHPERYAKYIQLLENTHKLTLVPHDAPEEDKVYDAVAEAYAHIQMLSSEPVREAAETLAQSSFDAKFGQLGELDSGSGVVSWEARRRYIEPLREAFVKAAREELGITIGQ
jgi:hypothetical protein